MATRAGLLRRYFSTSRFSLQITAAASAKTQPVPSTTIFIYGLCKRTTSERLHEEASRHGEVVHARVVLDRFSGFSEGYGFVKYATIAQAEQGIKGLDGQFLEAWVFFAEFARSRTPPGYSSSRENNTRQDEMDLPGKLLEASLKGEIVGH